MNPTEEFAVVITTCSSSDDAKTLADALLTDHLAACIQVIPITSYYTWKNAVNTDAEYLLLIKAKAALYAQIETCLRKHHKYETPEIVQLPISQGLPAYLQWIREVSK